jgi:predicted Zn-dependent peptidase
MNINSVNLYKTINIKSAFKGEQQPQQKVTTSPIEQPQAPAAATTQAVKAYVTPQMNTGYKIKEVFSIPFYPNQKLYELSNGMRVITIKRPGNTAIYTTVGVGKLNEPDDKRGMAHLMEHLVGHEGLVPKDEEDKKLVNDAGAIFNAETSDITTKYYTKAPMNNAETLDKFLKLQAKIIKNTDFARSDDEKKIINEEIGGKSKASGDWGNLNINTINTTLGQNLHNPQSKPQTLSKITNQDLTDFYNKYYNPDNMLTVIVGNVDDNTINLVAKDLGDLKKQPQPQTQTGFEISTDNPIQKTVRTDFIGENDKKDPSDIVKLSFVGPETSNIKDSYYTDFIKRAIEYKMLDKPNYTLTLADTQEISNDINKPTITSLRYTSKKENTEKELKQLYNVINDLQTKPLTQTDLTEIKKAYKSVLSSPMEHPDEIADTLSDTALKSSPNDKTMEYLNSFNPQYFQAVAKKYFDLNKASITVTHPKGETKPETQNSTPKASNVSFTGNINNKTDLHMEDVHEYILPNNLRVIIDAREGNMKSVVDFEAKLQNIGKVNPARAYFENEHNCNSTESNENSETYGSVINKTLTRDAIYKGNDTLNTVKQAKEALFNQKPVSQEEFLKSKDEFLNKPVNPKTLSDKIARNLNCEEAIYNNLKGWINNFTYEDYLKSKNDFFNNAQGCITISMPKENFEKDKDAIFKILETVPTLKPNNYAKFYNKFRPQPLEKDMVFTEKTDNNEIKVTKNFKIVETGNIKDRAALLLTSQLLGGDSNSKIFDKLRNKDKICYTPLTIVDSAAPTGDVSTLLLTAKTTDDKKDGLKTILNEFNSSIEELENNKITENELNRVKAKVKSELLGETESTDEKNRSISDYATSTFYGKNYLQELFNAIDTITADDIQNYSKYYLSQHSITGVEADKKVLDENREFLKTQGEIQA